MTRARAPIAVSDSGASHLEVAFYPYRDHTQTGVTLVRGLGSKRVGLRVWAGHLPVDRSALAGLGAAACVVLLIDQLRAALTDPDEPAVAAAGPGAPLGGPWGEAFPNTALPGLDLPV
jgi:hypothetical protein